MWIKIIGASILAMVLMGAGCEKTKTNYVETPGETVYVEVPAPEPDPIEPENVIPTAGMGSIKSDMDCSGGTITTNYSFGNVNEDNKNFVIQYQRNGALEDLTYPSASTTGSRALVKDIYYARPNDDDRDASWIVTISYQTASESYNLVTTTLKQPQCSDDVNSTVTLYEVK